MTRKHWFTGTALTALTALTLSAHALYLKADDALEIKFSSGFDYSIGDYGDTEDTEIWYHPFTTRLSTGNWSARVTVPYLRIKGSGLVVGGGDNVIQQTNPDTVTTEEGLGDVVASLTYTLEDETYDTYYDFTGKVKIPTADEDKSLGTGEFDYTLSFDVTKLFSQSYIFAGVGYKFSGENEDFQLDDVWIVNVGAGIQMTPKTGLGVSYDYREAAGSGEDPRDATLFMTHKLTDNLSLQAYGVTGFSDGSAEQAFGLQIGYKFTPFDRRD